MIVTAVIDAKGQMTYYDWNIINSLNLNDMSFTEMVHRKMTGLNILTEIQFCLYFDCTKSVVRWSKI